MLVMEFSSMLPCALVVQFEQQLVLKRKIITVEDGGADMKEHGSVAV